MMYEELSLDGDRSGIQGGVILTQLWDKLAVSSTLGYLQVIQAQPPRHHPDMEKFPEQAFNYSLSAGYLLFPRQYTSYKQTNLNLYAELLGQQTLDTRRFYVDFAPAIQLIFNSNSKLNVGYRIQLNSDMDRMAQNRLQLSFEYVFLNALKKRS
jgi:hypothetical protein